MLAMRAEQVSKPCVELPWMPFGEQGVVPDCMECSRHVLRDGPDIMSGVEGLHLLLGEQKQHAQGRVIWSE